MKAMAVAYWRHATALAHPPVFRRLVSVPQVFQTIYYFVEHVADCFPHFWGQYETALIDAVAGRHFVQ